MTSTSLTSTPLTASRTRTETRVVRPRFGRRLRSAPGYVVLGIWTIFSLFPLYFMLVSATNTGKDVLASRLLPGAELFNNFGKLIAQQDLGAALLSSFLIAIGTTVLALIVCSVAGYGFEVYHSKGKDILMGVLLLAIMIPFAATMIPLFQVFAKLGMINSLFAVIIPSISTPILILLFRQSSRSFPSEILEAARVDGLNEVAIFARIYVPTMRATFAAAGVITFMMAWNNYLWPRVILLRNEVQTMPMLTVNLGAGYVIDYGVLMLAVLIASLPTVLIFLILQRSFAEGITGAIK